VLAAYGADAALITLAALLPPGLAAAALADRLAGRAAPLERLRRHVALLVAACGAIVLAAVVVLVALMFVSGHDAFFTLVVFAYAAALALWTGRAVFDAMAARIAREEAMRRGLFAAVSHDLRTPLTSLRLLAEAEADGLGTADDAAAMRVHVAALSSLVDDLFELTRIEAGDLRWTLERVPLDALLRESADAMRSSAGGRALVVEADGAGVVAASPERLQRVVFNLLQNAIRHTPPDGTLVVRAEQVGDAVEVEVGDSGPGIPERDRERVFEPFFRGDLARTAAGAGLGLAISRAIIEAHGGRIWVAPAREGAHVRFRLPLVACLAVLAALVLAGCGSERPAGLPPAATPAGGTAAPAPAATLGGTRFTLEPARDRVVASDGSAFGVGAQPTGVAAVAPGRLGVVAGRARDLEVYDAAGRRVARAAAGVGPTRLASDGRGRVWVADTAGDAVLAFSLEPALRLVRRTAVPGAPYAIAYDAARDRVSVTASATGRVYALDPDRLHRLRVTTG
jgi:signal transduction histidine kinase